MPSPVVEEAPRRGGSRLEGGSPGMTCPPAPQDPVGADEGPWWALVEEAGRGLRGALATECLCPPVCSRCSSRSRSSRSMAATGPGSDSTGSTAEHTADTGYSWAEGRSVQ